MIVVADTSPLNYLIQIDADGLLHSLYERVLVPPAVMQELDHASSPASVRHWLLSMPSWIDIRRTNEPPDSTLSSLDPGEREAIQLAQEAGSDLLLIDERKGRLEAQRRNLSTTGTLGVLASAGELGLVDPETVFAQLLSQTSFRSTPQLCDSFLDAVRLSKRKKPKHPPTC